jgi:micrococcal nuclease
MSKVTPFAYRVKSMVKIIDGDTFDCILDLGFDVLLEARVRMAGIDTPESRTRDLIEKQFGLASKKYLIERIEAAQDIIVRTELDNEKGKFGRILGTVYLDDVDVNQQMITDGYAVGYHGQSKDDIEGQHLVNRDRLLTENKVQLDPDFGK